MAGWRSNAKRKGLGSGLGRQSQASVSYSNLNIIKAFKFNGWLLHPQR